MTVRQTDFWFRLIEKDGGEWLAAEGALTDGNVREFQAALGSLPRRSDRITIDMQSLDIEDGVALTVALNALRELGTHTERLVIVGAPQILGHNLYRAGMLGAGASIELVEMRRDEPDGQ